MSTLTNLRFSNTDRHSPMCTMPAILFCFTGVQIPKDLTESELIRFFEELFIEKLKGATVEIVTAVGSFLTTPNLMPNTALTALNLQVILRSCQTVFLRPSVKLVEVSGTMSMSTRVVFSLPIFIGGWLRSWSIFSINWLCTTLCTPIFYLAY